MDTKYDAIIIGAGIGGLVCGCYLAKAGKKVLIVEKNKKVGGYCTSFERKNFIFDTGVHTLSGFGENGRLERILNELDLKARLNLFKRNPKHYIVTHDFKIALTNNVEENLENIRRINSHEIDKVKQVFDLISSNETRVLYTKYKNLTFKDLIDKFVKDIKLKTLFDILVVTHLGIPASKASAFTSIILFREHIFEGGFYPQGGMQILPHMLLDIFKHRGGHLLLSKKAKKIRIRSNKVSGVLLDENNFISSKYVISSCDALQMIYDLVGEKILPTSYIDIISRLTPSPSAFVVYLGLSKKIKQDVGDCCALWYAPSYKKNNGIDGIYDFKYDKNSYLLFGFPSFHDENLAPENSESMFIFTNAYGESNSRWDNCKNEIAENIITISKKIMPFLTNQFIKIKEIATPYTFYKYTLNTNGAIRGWASDIYKVQNIDLLQKLPIENLYIAGQWSSQPGPGGILMAASSGRDTALRIIRKEERF